jgi:hypothetical protein
MILIGKQNILIFLSFIVFSFNSPFDDSEDNFTLLQHTTYAGDIEIEGIIVDVTQSKIEKDFYGLIYRQWNQLKNLLYHSSTINKKSISQLGPQFLVQIKRQVDFHQKIKPGYKVIEEIQNCALKKVYRLVKNCDKWQEHLQVEELQGIGIFKI